MPTAVPLPQAVVAAVVPVSSACRREERRGDTIFVVFGPERDCKSWHASRHQSGIWFYQFEGSQFVRGARTLAEAQQFDFRSRTVSAVSFDADSRFPGKCNPVLGHAYLISGYMRQAIRAKHPWPTGGGFGHMGLWSNAVLFDTINTLTDLGEMPGPQVRAAGLPPRACIGTLSSGNRR